MEQTICSDPSLSSLDQELGKAYRKALMEAGRNAFVIRADESRWLDGVHDECGSAIACIRQSYEARVSQLKSQGVVSDGKITVFRLAKVSTTYIFVVRMMAHTPDDLEGYLEGPAEISVLRKGPNTLLQTITMQNIFVALGNNGKPLTNTAPLYGDQGLINIGDFNFDGHEDFAVQRGNDGSYGLPTYSVFLFSTKGKRFSLSPSLSNLTDEGLGFFNIDAKKKHLVVLSKSGCCYHTTTEYRVEHDEPIPVSREIEDGTRDKNYMVVSHERYIDGKWQGTEEQIPMPK